MSLANKEDRRAGSAKSRDAAYYRDLIGVLVAKEFKVRYQSTFLGYLWSILNPLAFALVYAFVFGVFMRIKPEKYPLLLYFITGLFPWQWCLNSTSSSTLFFISNNSLIKKVSFPRSFLVLTGVLNDAIHFVIAIPIIAVFMVYYGFYPSISWLWWVPLLAAIQFLLIYGIALFLATCNLFFRDLERLTMIFTMMWFFLTPILYPTTFIPAKYQWTLYANPMAAMVICWREVLLEGKLPFAFCATGLGWSLVTFAIGYSVYRRLQWRFAEIV